MKLLVLCSAFALSTTAIAGGFSAPGVPTKIDVVRAEGFMINGEFGNPGSCTFANQLFIKVDHPQYKQIYAAVLAAYMGKQKISAYVHSCETVTWYTAPPNTYNIVSSSSALSISD